DFAGNDGERVFFSLVAGQRVMDFLHEPVKVGARLARDRRAVEETVHQETLAAPDATPKVNTLYCLLASKQPDERRLEAFQADQVFIDALQTFQRRVLRGVELETVLVRVLAHPADHVRAVAR